MQARHYRYNPLFGNPLPKFDPQTIKPVSFFKSIPKAKEFLLRIDCYDESRIKSENLQDKIADAKRIVAKAEERSEKRRERRKRSGRSAGRRKSIAQDCDSLDCGEAISLAKKRCRNIETEQLAEERPKRATRVRRTIVSEPADTVAEESDSEIAEEETPQEVALPSVKPPVDWEITTGPEGHEVYLKIRRDRPGSFRPDSRSKDKFERSIQPGQIILNTTGDEPRAFRVNEDRSQESIALSKEIIDYAFKQVVESKYRQYKSGAFKLNQLADQLKKIAKVESAARAKARRRLSRRKNKK